MFAPRIQKPEPEAVVKAAAPARPARPLDGRDSKARSPRQIGSLMRGAIQRKPASGAGASGGTCASCEDKESGRLQRKLTIGSSHDPLEHEADRVAEQVMAGPSRSDFRRVPISIQRLAPGAAPGARQAPASVDRVLASSGRTLDAPLRRDMETRFGHDFSQVRVHDGAEAGQSARDVGAQAYTVGPNIAFAPGRYAPSSDSGRRLLAHELAHVVQQGSAYPTLRRQGVAGNKKEKHLRDYNDADAKHDPARLTDAEIEATVEFKAFMDSSLIWQWKDKVTRAEALLASRLILRQLREGKHVKWDSGARGIMSVARKQLGTLKATEGNVGKFSWVQFQNKVAVKDPSKMESDFGRWLLAGETEPDSGTGKINCWEMMLFSAFKAGLTSKARLQKMYDDGLRLVKKGTYKSVGQSFEAKLRRGNENVWDPNNPNSAEPLPGDIVVFDKVNNHAAISLGTKEKGSLKRHEIISHWPPPDNDYRTKRTTIEELLPHFRTKPVVKFWSPKW